VIEHHADHEIKLDLERDGVPTVHADVHLPQGKAVGTLLVAHGFMGYKDYGMLPRIAKTAVEEGWAAVKFNFAHSGMSRSIEKFEYPEHFAKSTWNRQVEDLGFVMEAIRNGCIEPTPADGPIVCFGHSRGGTSVLLEAGRAFSGEELPRPDGVIALAAPAGCGNVSILTKPELRADLESNGEVEVVSNRTGQTLSIHRCFFDEINADPVAHDTLTLIGKITCPMLLAHGLDDPTVAVGDVDALAQAAEACPDLRCLRIAGADHVMNVSNPLSEEESSPQLEEFLGAMVLMLKDVAKMRGVKA
jgi:predicted alpha/beta-hydrolase family hydrolase